MNGGGETLLKSKQMVWDPHVHRTGLLIKLRLIRKDGPVVYAGVFFLI